MALKDGSHPQDLKPSKISSSIRRQSRVTKLDATRPIFRVFSRI